MVYDIVLYLVVIIYSALFVMSGMKSLWIYHSDILRLMRLMNIIFYLFLLLYIFNTCGYGNVLRSCPN